MTKRGSLRMIYFDNSATTPIFPQALDTYIKTIQRIIGNPSSLHDLGTQSNRLLQQARKQIADQLNVSPREIFFTSGGTEGDNWVLKGTAIEKRDFGNHMIISSIEHPAVSETAAQLKDLGMDISIVPVTKVVLLLSEYLECSAHLQDSLLEYYYYYYYYLYLLLELKNYLMNLVNFHFRL